jgi:hypothetical protein
MFWFDMNTVLDPVPKTPKILDKIFGTSQLGLLDSLKSARVKSIDGFRLQVYETSAVEEANRKFKKFEKVLNDSLYLVFDAPLYKLHYGNFVTKKDAETQKVNLKRKGYKNVWIVRSRIEQLDSLVSFSNFCIFSST